MSDWLTEKRALEQQLKDANAQLKSYRIREKALPIALRSGVVSEHLADVLTITRGRFDLDARGRLVVLDKDGDPSYKSAEQFFKEDYRAERPKFYEPYEAPGASGGDSSGGGNAAGSTAGVKTLVSRADFDKIGAQERMDLMKSGAHVHD